MRYHRFHLRHMLALFSMGSTEGSDVSAIVPSKYGHYWLSIVIIVIGMFVLAFMHAKVMAHETPQTLPISQILENFEAIQGMMQQQKVYIYRLVTDTPFFI